MSFASAFRLPLTLIVLSSVAPACRGADSPVQTQRSGEAGGGSAGSEPSTQPPRRVVGYLPTYRSLDPTYLDLAALTHLCVAFANPTGEGAKSDFEVTAREKIAPLVKAAHARGVKVLASIAGGTKASGEIVLAQITEENRASYVANLVELLARYDLDGIDVDLEGEAVNELYEPFVKLLRSSLPQDKLLTAAVATKNRDAFPDGALRLYDFVNIMSYDQCSWSVAPCDQASLDDSKKDLDYWTKTRKIPRERAVLGVPFYGWCWGCTASQSALTYYDILWKYPEAKTEDWIRKDGVEITLNSAATIRTKATLALDYGGVMMWELGQDGAGEDSLLKVIKEVQPVR